MKRIAAAFALAAIVIGTGAAAPSGQAAAHRFTLGKDDFLLDGAPFQIIGCEMHPARIPAEYWPHRIRMAKAMGCNTIGAYLFWNYHETAEGVFDFTTGNRDVARFVRLAQEEGLVGAAPARPVRVRRVGLWRHPGLPAPLPGPQGAVHRTRGTCRRPNGTSQRLAAVVTPLMVAGGGPILMVQIENEYGSYGNDRAYMDRLKEVWVKAGSGGSRSSRQTVRRRTCSKPGTWRARPSASTRGRRAALGAGALPGSRRPDLLVRDLSGLADALGRGVGRGRSSTIC